MVKENEFNLLEKLNLLKEKEIFLSKKKETYLQRHERKKQELINEEKILQRETKNFVHNLIKTRLGGEIIKRVRPDNQSEYVDWDENEYFDYYLKIIELINREDKEEKDLKPALPQNPFDLKLENHQQTLKEITTNIDILSFILEVCNQNNEMSGEKHTILYEGMGYQLCYLAVLTEQIDNLKTTKNKNTYKPYDKQKNRCFELMEKADVVYKKINKNDPPNYADFKNPLWD